MSSVKYNRLLLTELPVVTSDFNTSSTNATEVQKIQASDRAAGDNFGRSVSINSVGNTMIIGSYLDLTVGANAGSSYIFTKNASDIWSERQKLQASDIQAGDYFGLSVTMNAIGNVAIVGATREDTGGSNAGAAYIFTQNSSDIWNERQKLQASDRLAYDEFGFSVAINSLGDTAIVGSVKADAGGFNSGATYIFTKNTSDVWSERQKLLSSDIQADDYFGRSVAINNPGNIAVVGAPRADAGGSNSGAAYIFTKNTSDIWSERQKLLSSDLQAGDSFGRSVDINDAGNIVIIGAHLEDGVTVATSDAGAAYIFAKNSSDVWYQQQKIRSSDLQVGDVFGQSVAMNSLGTIAVIGAERENTGGSNAGAAYVFTKNSSDIWSERQKLLSSDIQAGDFFGRDVIINSSGNIIAITAVNEDTGGADAGAAYIFSGNVSDTPIGGVRYDTVPLYNVFRMVSDTILKIKQ